MNYAMGNHRRGRNDIGGVGDCVSPLATAVEFPEFD